MLFKQRTSVLDIYRAIGCLSIDKGTFNEMYVMYMVVVMIYRQKQRLLCDVCDGEACDCTIQPQ